MNMGLIEIRNAQKNDISAIAEFQVEMALETENKRLDQQKVLAGVERLMNNPEYGYYIVAQTAERIIACLMITYEWSDWNDGLFWWIQSVYVKPEMRKHGVFKAMFACLQKLAASDKNCTGLRLYVEKNNMTARKAYENLSMKQADYCIYEVKV